MQWRHKQELAEAKHHTDLIVMELRQSMEAEKSKCIADFKKQAEIEKQKRHVAKMERKAQDARDAGEYEICLLYTSDAADE